MSSEALNGFINKTVKYGGLVARFKKEPDELLIGVDLTPAELAALKSGEEQKLVAAGVEETLAKRWMRNLEY